jgi:hypothetical protein
MVLLQLSQELVDFTAFLLEESFKREDKDKFAKDVALRTVELLAKGKGVAQANEKEQKEESRDPDTRLFT